MTSSRRAASQAVDPDDRVVLNQALSPDRVKDAGLNPLLEAAVRR